MLWLDDSPLVLASKSRIRREILEAAGIPVYVVPADLDERAVEARFAADAATTALVLAREKARTVAANFRERLVLGADQVLAIDGLRFAKPASADAARERLEQLAGRSHELFSAVALVRGNNILFEHLSSARLIMRSFSKGFLDRYLHLAGPVLVDNVGSYEIEGLGIHLFEAIEGDHFTILGLPLLPLLAFLRSSGLLAA